MDENTKLITAPSRESWLNGWQRDERFVMTGNLVRCVCCGGIAAAVTVAIEDDWQPPPQLPSFPFEEADCPLCASFGPTWKRTTQETPPEGMVVLALRNDEPVTVYLQHGCWYLYDYPRLQTPTIGAKSAIDLWAYIPPMPAKFNVIIG